jgi:hypothetical protein
VDELRPTCDDGVEPGRASNSVSSSAIRRLLSGRVRIFARLRRVEREIASEIALIPVPQRAESTVRSAWLPSPAERIADAAGNRHDLVPPIAGLPSDSGSSARSLRSRRALRIRDSPLDRRIEPPASAIRGLSPSRPRDLTSESSLRGRASVRPEFPLAILCDRFIRGVSRTSERSRTFYPLQPFGQARSGRFGVPCAKSKAAELAAPESSRAVFGGNSSRARGCASPAAPSSSETMPTWSP